EYCKPLIQGILTVIFILIPSFLVICWNFYIHYKREDTEIKREDTEIKSIPALFFLNPLAPVLAFLENTYFQWKFLEDQTKKGKENEAKADRYHLKQNVQLKTAITNVLEASLESTFQVTLQMWILFTSQ
ncbi:unnamed protein product, partial [Meganyctiphanes norvegica]